MLCIAYVCIYEIFVEWLNNEDIGIANCPAEGGLQEEGRQALGR